MNFSKTVFVRSGEGWLFLCYYWVNPTRGVRSVRIFSIGLAELEYFGGRRPCGKVKATLESFEQIQRGRELAQKCGEVFAAAPRSLRRSKTPSFVYFQTNLLYSRIRPL